MEPSFSMFLLDSPEVSKAVKSPSPKKVLRQTNACSNIHALLKEVDDPVSDEENKSDEEPAKLFEDECPEESLKMKKKTEGEQNTRKRPASSSGFAPNYVKANLKRKTYTRKKSSAVNTKRFKRFKRAK
ncbi:hypothetical protein M3Y97_00389900 [Aphelenchoides bicaudatus]|nr:hypothetical protein M3Y97_00389900 [Aphelenchoides bicaudatus]